MSGVIPDWMREQQRVDALLGPQQQQQAPLWDTVDPAYASRNNGAATIPYANYFQGPGQDAPTAGDAGHEQALMPVAVLSNNMQEALAKGDVQGYKTALDAYKQATDGQQPPWSFGITPEQVQMNARNPGGVNDPRAPQPTAAPTQAAPPVRNTGGPVAPDAPRNNRPAPQVPGATTTMPATRAIQQTGITPSVAKRASAAPPEGSTLNGGRVNQTGVAPTGQNPIATRTPVRSPAAPDMGITPPVAPGQTGVTPPQTGVAPPQTGVPGQQPSRPTYTPPSHPTVNPVVDTPDGYGKGVIPGGNPGGTGLTNQGFKAGGSPMDIINNDRLYAYSQGGGLLSNFLENAAQQNQRATNLTGLGDRRMEDLYQNPGYTQAQDTDIRNQQGLDDLQLSAADKEANFQTGDEVNDIKGHPYLGAEKWDESAQGLQNSAAHYGDQLKDIYDSGSTSLDTGYADESQRLDDAVNANRLSQSSGVVNNTGQALANQKSAAGSAIDRGKLGLSGEYQSQYNFTPQDEQDMVAQAGRSVGIHSQAQQDDLMRRAAAEGNTSTLGVAAAKNRIQQSGDADSSDAMLNAKIAARQLGLNTTQTKENTRLGAEQNLSGMQYRSAMDQGSAEVAQANALEQQRLQSEQDISSRRMSNAQVGGAQNAQNQQFLTQGRAQAGLQTGKTYLDTLTNNATQTANYSAAGEAAAAQRAQALAQNRQAVNQANQAQDFTRGTYADTQASGRAKQIADATRADQTTARADVRNQQQQGYGQQNAQDAAAVQTFTGITGAGSAAANSATAAAQIPSTFEKVAGAAVGAAAAAGLAHGGVITHPTVARIGESGPEMVVKLHPGGPMMYRRRNEAAYA